MRLPPRVPVLNHGYIELVGTLPADGDLISAVAKAARVSYATGTGRQRSDQGLVEYLLANHHWSPFDQVKLQWEVRMPNFVRDQWVRHWSWDFNIESARYSEMKPQYYVPQLEQVSRQSAANKQGRGTPLDQAAAALIRDDLELTAAHAFDAYRQLIAADVSRELARVILPHGTYTSMVATCSLRDFLVFCQQRLDEHAQWEIRQYAQAAWGILYQLDPAMAAIARNYFIDAVTLSADEWLVIRNLLSSRVASSEVLAATDGLGLSARQAQKLLEKLRYGT